MQEGHHAILKAVVEKMKARGPGWLWGKTRHLKTPAAVYDIKEWMWGLVGDPDGEPKWNDNTNHRPDWWSDPSW